MRQFSIKVSQRQLVGKGANRRLRASGKIPAVIYGAGDAPQKVALQGHEFEVMMGRGEAENAILSMEFDAVASSSEVNTVVIRELQRDPVTRHILHVDLYRIRMDVENDFEVPIHGVGSPIGVKEGGILESQRRVVEIRCLPTILPSSIEIDLADLKVNHSKHVSDLIVPDGVTVLSDPDEVLFTILPPKAEAVPAAAEVAAEEVAEPEVIGKKKEEGEGEAPAASEKK